jgi:hypothetical protein
MVLDVLEDDVDGLALVLSRPARGAARAKVSGEGLDGLANVTQSRVGLLGRARLGRRGSWRVAAFALGNQAECVA